MNLPRSDRLIRTRRDPTRTAGKLAGVDPIADRLLVQLEEVRHVVDG